MENVWYDTGEEKKKREKETGNRPTFPDRRASGQGCKGKGGGTHGPGTAARGGDPQGIRKRKPRWNLTDKKKAGK